MEAVIKELTGYVALGAEGCAALFILFGAFESIYVLLKDAIRPSVSGESWSWTLGRKKWVWIHFARWLVLALEFELAADILRTAITPTWDEIGQLAAIAVIRTFLNYFLSRDVKEAVELERAGAPDAFPAIKSAA
jgi:uncharacterized membrane protein